MEARNAERAVLLAAAGVELLRVHSLLADHAVALGAADKLLRILAANAPQGAHLLVHCFMTLCMSQIVSH